MTQKLFKAKYMDLDIKTTSKVETIKYLASLISENINDTDEYIKAVMDREAMSTTGIGDGIAIPHGKSKAVTVPTVAFGRTERGIEWESLDDEPANLIFLIAVPDGAGDEHLQILKKLAISLMDEDFKEKLVNACTAEQVEELLGDQIEL